MPLIKSGSKGAFSKNVSAEVKSGRPQKQALAIAYRIQRDNRAAGGGVPFTVRSQARQMERSGMINSPVAGRTDKLPMGVKPGSYIMPADVVSAVGQGNSSAGANAFNKLFKMGPFGSAMPRMPGSGAMRPQTGGMMRGRRGFADGGMVGEPQQEPVDIMAAGGEFLVSPSVVAEIGGGDLEEGHNILDAMVKQIRAKTIKTLRNLPGPKT